MSHFVPFVDRTVGANAGSKENILSATSSAAVHAAFDRIESSLPEYVSFLPAASVGAVVALIVMLSGYTVSMKDRREQSKLKLPSRSTSATAEEQVAKDMQRLGTVLLRERWRFILLGHAVVAMFLFNRVSQTAYTTMLLSHPQNRKHFAVVQFLRMYRTVLS